MDDSLILRFIHKQCSIEEARKVLRWIEADERNKKYFIRLQSIWASIDIEYASRHEEADAEQVRLIINKIRRKRSQRTFYISLAAGVAVALLLFWFLPSGEEVQYDYEKALARISNQKEITLSFQEDEKIELPDSSVTFSYNKKGQVLINDTVAIEEKKETKENNLNVIHVPYGKRSIIILADGTKVYLNSGSSLAYPAKFAAAKREVYLEGEGYFEVAKEEDRHFIVQTAYKAVEVLGTQFNVFIDEASHTFETVLVNGRIELESNDGKIELSPNQLYTFSYESKEEEFKTVEVENYISWIEGRLKFTGETLSNVINKLEKAYNVKIIISEPKYLDYKITGSLNLRDTPESTLDVLMKILIPNYKSKTQKLYQIKK